MHLGLGRMSVSDLPGWQGRISYEDWLTPKAIAREMRRLGVTHVLWETDTSHESDSFAGDLAFYRYVSLATADKRTFGPFTLATLAREPLEDDPGKVAWYECPASNGELFSLEAVAAEEFDGLPIPPIDADSAPPAEASFVVLNRTCHEASPAQGWTLGANRGHYALWIRAVGDGADERHAEAEPVHPIVTPISPSRR